MKYNNLILEAFNKYKLIPRAGQVDAVNLILKQFIDENKTNVVLSGSTGSGKSILAVITTECLFNLLKTPQEKKDYKSALSYILMHTNTLTEQYRETFTKYDNFLTIKGARNYECPIVRDTAESCMLRNVKKSLAPKIMPGSCKNCEYRITRQKMAFKPHLITNYSYYFVSALYAKSLQNRLITVYDESHLLNDIFASHLELNITTKKINFLRRILNDLPITDSQKKMGLLLGFKRKIETGKVNDFNYKEFMRNFFILLAQIGSEYDSKAMSFYSLDKKDDYTKHLKASKIFLGFTSKYEVFTDHNYESVIDIDKTKISLKPIFIKKMFQLLNKSKYNLFMSATISKEYISKTLDIPLDEIGFVKPPPTFAPETKEIVFINHHPYNYAKMQDKLVLADICNIIKDIIIKHKGESGIILTPSFVLNDFITNELKKYRQLSDTKIISQERGQHLSIPLEIHKNTKKPSVLISPSLFEGIDLPNEQSMWQIFIKAPYASLADKRIKQILNKYPDIYKINTLFKIIQGFGRSTRNAKDHSVTYCLDSHIYNLYKDKNNKWKDEFKIIKLQ